MSAKIESKKLGTKINFWIWHHSSYLKTWELFLFRLWHIEKFYKLNILNLKNEVSKNEKKQAK